MFSEVVSSRTAGVVVTVQTVFIPEQSNPGQDHYMFAYRITITNESDHTVQLLRRHWVINDSDGQVREVEGDGVIGLQPVLLPGESHAYDSYCDLGTEFGKMSGTYLMSRRDDESLFEVTIPEFRMVAPFKLN